MKQVELVGSRDESAEPIFITVLKKPLIELSNTTPSCSSPSTQRIEKGGINEEKPRSGALGELVTNLRNKDRSSLVKSFSKTSHNHLTFQKLICKSKCYLYNFSFNLPIDDCCVSLPNIVHFSLDHQN